MQSRRQRNLSKMSRRRIRSLSPNETERGDDSEGRTLAGKISAASWPMIGDLFPLGEEFRGDVQLPKELPTISAGRDVGQRWAAGSSSRPVTRARVRSAAR